MKKIMFFCTVLASLCLAGAALAETIDKASGLVPGAPSLDRSYVVTEELDLSETTLASSNTYKMVTLPEFYLPTHVVVSLEDVAVTNSCNVQFYWTGGGFHQHLRGHAFLRNGGGLDQRPRRTRPG